jgi:DNA-binding NarL/FixJ family response regulator
MPSLRMAALRAFLVEDSPAIRAGLVEALAELAGVHTSGVAATQAEAIAWLADPAHQWDIAIVDLLLEPGGSGLAVLKALQQRSPAQKAVVLTATATSLVRRHCEALGSDEVFDKSMETEALLDYCAALARVPRGG